MAATRACVSGGLVLASSRPSSSRHTSSSAVAHANISSARRQGCALFNHGAHKLIMPALQRPNLRRKLRIWAIDTARTGVDAREKDNRGYKWDRVLLKVSGEALAGDDGFGIDNSMVQHVAEEIAVACMKGVQVA
eukprot:CAMPEP_0118932962 /NCGR_PEP_ID=MMETSP1169-20130426/10811_1 /TAXON_ID=36882 /ORGANISM="Pyramimonas obovata, Strain CCMP722" /LENGTH=134 /DNA_ID=CAMNT_0006875671 /DNA_START=111 /DNA_END=511 /DNA_ORIENTATION=+